MATKLTTTTFATTYKDDYKDSDHYHRILFNSGRALQARELTQMQTIIQKEIARFGRNIFVEGAAVRPGGLQIKTYDYIILDTSGINNQLPDNPNDLVGEIVEAYGAGIDAVKFKILEVVTTPNPTLYGYYIDTTSGTPKADSGIVVQPNASLSVSLLGEDDLKVRSTSPTGKGTKASVEDGDFFVQEHFVFVTKQEIWIDKYSAFPDAKVGFIVNQEVVTTDDTNDLYDNQGAAPNIAAPGADRLRITLALTLESEADSDDNFVYIGTIQNGDIIHQMDATDGYNRIYDFMALRTKEESGNYVLNPITAKFNDVPDNDSALDLEISRGTSYVDGYRLDLPPVKIRVKKARDTVNEVNQNILAQYGNYVIGDGSSNKGLPSITNFPTVNLYNAVTAGGSVIGTARVRAVEPSSGNVKLYLFDLQMNTDEQFRETKSIGNSATDYVDLVLTDGIAVLQQTADNSLLFDLPSNSPTSGGITNVDLTVQGMIDFTHNGTSYTLQAPETNDVLTFSPLWVLTTSDGAVVSGATYTPVAGVDPIPDGYEYTITGVAADDYRLYYYVAKDQSNVSIGTKTLGSNENITKMWPDSADSDGTGTFKWLSLDVADVYEVNRIRTVDSDGTDLLDYFTFDNGQRDNYYDFARLIPKPGVTPPDGDIYARYKKFTTSGGDLHAITSYASLNYADVQDYTKSNGEEVNLRDVLDFRPIRGTNGSFATGHAFPLPLNTDVIGADVEYYLARKDKLVVSAKNIEDVVKTGYYSVIRGVSDVNPQTPTAPNGAMTLYNITLNPYTLNREDATLEYVPNKRYTMKDIGRIEDRVNELFELTTLSLLENQTATLTVLDSVNNPRTKSGFLVDNFSNYAFSDVNNLSYRAAIDLGRKEVTPPFSENSIRLIYDSDHASTTTIRKGDMAMLPYTEREYINQDLCSGELLVNPFGVILARGHIKLSPSSDDWIEVQYEPDVVLDGGEKTKVKGTQNVKSRNDSKYNWYGTDGKFVITGSKSVTEFVEEVVLDRLTIPYMRSIKINFKGQGLRPNAEHFAFFNGTSVADWVRAEDTFSFYSSGDSDYGNTLTNATQHPQGSSQLYSDSNGELIGSFVIPSTEEERFRTGSVIFKLLDISDGASDELATSSAFTNFTSTGIIEVTEKHFVTTRHVTLATAVVVQPSSSGGGGDNDNPTGGGRTEMSGSGDWGNPGSGHYSSPF